MSEISKNQIKLVKSLHLKKFRMENGLFACEGRKVVEELVQSPIEVVDIYCEADLMALYPSAIEVSHAEMTRMSNFKSAPGILAVARIPKITPMEYSFTSALLLDRLNDPGNLGTIARSAAWFGVNEIFLLGETVDPWNPKVIHASMGAVFNVGIRQADENFVKQAKQKGYSLIGADMEGIPVKDFQWPEKSILVIGSESHGISKELRVQIDSFTSIPIVGTGESLNAGVAASVILNYLSQ